MMGRREFGLAGLSAAAVLATRGAAFAQPAGRQGGTAAAAEGHGDHAMFDECAKACGDCQRECDACANHCTDLLSQGKKEHAETLRTCQDCADVCATAASIVARKGPFSADICKACADACAKCGEACEQFNQDPMMKRCAEECRRCEEACREMLRHAGHSEAGGQSRKNR